MADTLLTVNNLAGNRAAKHDEFLGRAAFSAAYFSYVFTNAAEFRDILPVEIKHLIFLIIAFASLLRRPKEALFALLALSPIAFIYLLGGLPVYSGMVVIFALSLPVIYQGISGVIRSEDYRFLLWLVLIALIPFFMAMPSILEVGMFDDLTYGRPRMLMGYYHPKEAAISFAIPALIYFLMIQSSRLPVLVLSLVFLWLISSRNVAVTLFLVWFIRWYPRWAVFCALVAMLFFLLFLFINSSWYEMLDQMSSLRLSVWNDVLSSNNQLVGLDVENGERFGADSFFVELLVLAGLPGFFIFIIGIICVYLAFCVKKKEDFRPAACFYALLFASFFDTGIASTGNMMHVVLWAIILSPMFDLSPNQRPIFLRVM